MNVMRAQMLHEFAHAVAPATTSMDQLTVLAKPRLWARETACARFSTPSFTKICLTCDFTVSGAMARVWAISLLERPLVINLSISPSRFLSNSENHDSTIYAR